MDLLDNFYTALQTGMPIQGLLEQYTEVLQFVHANGLTNDMRLARGRVKRLCDEVPRITRFVKHNCDPINVVQFPLDSGPIDCNITSAHGFTKRIQITVAQARARMNVMTELNEKGAARGYIGVTDDRPTAEFTAVMSRERIAYSTAGAQKTLLNAIALCVGKKAKAQGADTLLIDAPLNILPKARVDEIVPDLVELAMASPFPEVFVVGDGEHRDSCFKLK